MIRHNADARENKRQDLYHIVYSGIRCDEYEVTGNGNMDEVEIQK